MHPEGTPWVNAKLDHCFGTVTAAVLVSILGDDRRYVKPTYVGAEPRIHQDNTKVGFAGARHGGIFGRLDPYPKAVCLFLVRDRHSDLDGSPFPAAATSGQHSGYVSPCEIDGAGQVTSPATCGEPDGLACTDHRS